MSHLLPADVIYGARGRYRLDEAAPRTVGPARIVAAEGPTGPVELRFAIGDEAWLLEETALLRAMQPLACTPEVLDLGRHEGRIYVVHPAFPLNLAGWLAVDRPARERARAALLVVRAVQAVHEHTRDATLALSPASFGVRGGGDALDVRLIDPGVVAARTGFAPPGVESYTPPEARIGRASAGSLDAWAVALVCYRALCGALPQAVVTRTYSERVERYEALAGSRPLPIGLSAELDALDAAPIDTFYAPDPALLPHDELMLRDVGADDTLIAALAAMLQPDPGRRETRLDPLALALAALVARLPEPPPARVPTAPLLPKPRPLPSTALLGIVLAAGVAVAWWATR